MKTASQTPAPPQPPDIASAIVDEGPLRRELLDQVAVLEQELSLETMRTGQWANHRANRLVSTGGMMGGASRPRQRSPGKSLPTNSPVRPRPDPANPLLNPATSIRHVAEDTAPPQPNELPEPDGTPSASDADSAHPLGAHERQSSR